jgi:Uma2 family endonuclease
MSPQRRFHERVISAFRAALNVQAPASLTAVMQMDVKLAKRSRPRPDVVVVDSDAADDPERTFYLPAEIQLVVEVVSPESEDRDRLTKPQRYAQAGLPHFWRVEENGGRPVVYVCELDPSTSAYAITGIHHSRLELAVPFPVSIDLDNLPR